MRRHVFILAATILGWILPGPAQGQDTHYWTEQYGARSMLLSGSVIGSVNDMSAVFYNPGALGYLIKPELVLSASAYQIRQLKVKDGGGPRSRPWKFQDQSDSQPGRRARSGSTSMAPTSSPTRF